MKLPIPIEEGTYRTRGGGTAKVTETGSFAYGIVGRDMEFWELETGITVGFENHANDLVEMVESSEVR